MAYSAREFEHHWPGRHATGVPQLDAADVDWAQRVATVLRSNQVAVLTGERSVAFAADGVFDLLVGFVTRDPKVFDVAPEHEPIRVTVTRRVLASVRPLLVVGVAAAIMWAAFQPRLGLAQELRAITATGAISVVVAVLSGWLLPATAKSPTDTTAPAGLRSRRRTS